MVADDFVSLHTHTHASRFDGLGNAEQFVERAHELGQTAISFTEHGNLCGLYEQHLATLKGNMKLLPGVEAYLADDAEMKGLGDEEKAEIKAQYTEKELQAQAIKDAQRVRKERDHITVWAQTQEGLRNLYRLTSWSWNEGFYCLLPGQEIMTSSGVKPVEEIEVGDRVLTHKGRLKRVESTFSRPFDGKIYGIKLNNRYGRITWMTGEHPVLIRTRDGKVDWVRADEVKGGRARKSDSIDTWASFVCLPKVRPETEVSTVKISDWAKSWDFDGQTFSKEIPRQTMPSTYSYFRCDDEISLDYEFGMFLGLFCAEGGYDRENGFEFSFHQEEIGFIELVKKVLRDKFGLEATSNTREDRPGYKGISLRVYSQVVTEFMLKMCGRGSNNMHLPPFSFESPKEFRRGLLDGIFGGDAAENDSATVFTQTSRSLCWQVRSLAAGFYESFPCVVEVHDGNPNHSVQFRTNYAPRGPRRAGRHTLADDSYVYRPIAEVLVRDYVGPVFNFGVEDDESYVSDFVMHNCKPRIDIKRLRQFGKGLAVSTGCPGGVITSPLRAGKTDEALRRMAELSDIFGDRLYVEIMPHQMADCPDLASRMVKLADRFGCQVLATQDAHYPRPGDAHPQEVLLCINTRDRMSRPPKGADCTDGRFCFDHQHYYLRGRQAMAEALRKVPGLTEAVIQKSLDNTVDFADRVRLSMYDHSLTAEQVEKGLLAKPGEYLVAPELPPEHKSYDRWLISLITDACKARWGLAPMQIEETYRERLLLEMGRIIESGFSRYFIAVWEMIDWARKAGIMVGPGRGSVGGSLVAHLIGLSTLDPVVHKLSFDRFINVGRKDYPDIDTDFDYRRRGDVIRHLQELYGQDRVALIGTLNTYGGKAALNEVGKVNGLAGHEVAAVTGLIVTAIEEENQDDGSLRDVLAETEAGQDFANRYPDVVSVATRLEGLIRAAGVHAAGVVISSHPLADIVPLESRPRDDGTRMATIAWPMEAVEAAGLVKLDALGLTTLGWLSTALEWVERNGTRLDLASLPLDDQPTLDLLTRNEFVGVFQYDTPGSRRLCADFTFTKFDDIAVMTALNRPGPTKSGLAQMYLDRAADPRKIPAQHPAVAEATADTLGCLIYQEQVVAVAAGLCGYDPKAADDFRKKISKKKGLSDELEKFIAGAQKNGMEYEEALEIFNEIKEFAAYCFNRAHAYSYGLLAYWTAYMKVHYPAEFYCGALANENRPERQVRLAQDARRAGIPVGAPEINTSGSHFAIRRINGRDEIVGAAVDLKGIGQKATDAIVASQPFESIVDLARRTDRAVTAKTFEILAKATAFRYLFPHARYLAENAKEVFADAKKGFEPTLPESYVEWTDAEAVTAATSVYPLYVGESGLSTFELDERAARGRLKWPLYPVGDEELDGLESALVFGRVQQCKLYPEENGRSGRATLLGWDGTEIAAKMDVDVVDRYYDAVKKAGVHVVGLVRFFRGRASADAFWKVSDLDTDTCQVLQWLQSPGETDPADPVRIAQKRRRGDELVLDGLVVRRREHVDKKGGKMATLGIMAQRSYVQALVFSRDWADLAEAIQFGGRYAFRAEKLDGGGLRIDAVINDSGDRPRRRK
jgi:DNA-directed DNA polymerase III PolC